jgi:hypothetical protein
MNIIFKKNLINIDEKYTVLELDTFSLPDESLHTAYCVIENIPIMELAQTENLKELHANLIKNYALKDWNYCEQALEHLTGKWGGEVDSFYHELATRIEHLKTRDLDDSWTPIIAKTE